MSLDNLTDEQIDEAAFRMALRTVRLEVHQAVVEARSGAGDDEPCPTCDGGGSCPACRDEDTAEDCEDCRWTGECPECRGTGRFGLDPASALTQAWEAAGDDAEGQVVS